MFIVILLMVFDDCQLVLLFLSNTDMYLYKQVLSAFQPLLQLTTNPYDMSYIDVKLGLDFKDSKTKLHSKTWGHNSTLVWVEKSGAKYFHFG